MPANDFNGLVQYAKAHPGEISYATLGAGSAQEILARQIEKLAGIQMNRIPFRTGSQAMPDLIAGRVSMYVSPTIGVLPQHTDKQLKILATTSPQRLKGMSRRADAQGEAASTTCATASSASAPRRARRSRSSICSTAISSSIVAMPEYRDLIEKGGSLPESSTPAELGQVITQTVTDVEATIREFGMQQE